MILEENMNLAVFCAESILKKEREIDVVFHDEDDDFSFFNRLELDRRICLLSLEEVVNLDPSVMPVLDIPRGYAAWRESYTSEWVIEPFEDS